MIRRQLATVPIEKGDRYAKLAILLWFAFALGWVSHEWTVPLFCWYPV
jgi:hypothetical protein